MRMIRKLIDVRSIRILKEKDLDRYSYRFSPFLIALNLYMNYACYVLGYPIAIFQNRSTVRRIKRGLRLNNLKDKELKDKMLKDKKIVYLMPGLVQNIGINFLLFFQLRREGFLPFHIHGNHRFASLPYSVDMAYSQIDAFHKKIGLKRSEAIKRSDIFSGHSNGGNVSLVMGFDKRSKAYGIGHIQARSPASKGLGDRSFSQHLISFFYGRKRFEKLIQSSKKYSLMLTRTKPIINIHIIAGKNDYIVPFKISYLGYCKDYTLIDDLETSHFATAGSNPRLNRVFVDEAKRY